MVAAASVSILFCSGTPRGIDTLDVEFVVLSFTIYRVICEPLETVHRVTHASECLGRMVDELAQEIKGKGVRGVLGGRSSLRSRWHLRDNPLSEFKPYCCEKLEDLGVPRRTLSIMTKPSVALALDPVSPQSLFIERSKAYIAGGFWDSALNDANKVCPLISRRLVLVHIFSSGD